MIGGIAELPWLVPAPKDFRRLCQDLERQAAPTDAEVRRLSSFGLDVNQLVRLSKAIESVRPRIVRTGAISDLRISLLSDTTTDYIAPALIASAPRHGILLEVVPTPYDQIAQYVLSDDSPLKRGKIDAALLCLDARRLGLDKSTPRSAEAADTLNARVAYLRTLVTRINHAIGVPAILQTLVPPAEPWCGSYDRIAEGSARNLVERYNAEVVELGRSNSNVLFDVQALAAIVGSDRWLDPRQWFASKVPFSLDLVPIYADHVSRVFAAIRGKTRKCLVLDLDNTLWGGVIGDDGLEGLQLGQGSADGEAHVSLQQYALQCRERGIVLAVCSKNEADVALSAFRTHPEMALKEEHIAVFRANWEDKASNLRHIAKLLNIGTDALVFVDDNPFEREQVRTTLPEVAVPEMPGDPSAYVRVLAGAGYFEAIALSVEDINRADAYKQNAARSEAMEVVGNFEDYLKSLEMTCTLQSFDPVGRARIAQLINKSNQFNLTTRRYTEAHIAEMECDPTRLTLQVRLRDKFGDNGMISVVIFNVGKETWECDTWLMSCRVLGRRVEEAVLAEVVRAAKDAKAERLVGHYVPSSRNKMVQDHFAKLGFRQVADREDGGTTWELDLSEYRAPDLPMTILRETREQVAA